MRRSMFLALVNATAMGEPSQLVGTAGLRLAHRLHNAARVSWRQLLRRGI